MQAFDPSDIAAPHTGTNASLHSPLWAKSRGAFFVFDPEAWRSGMPTLTQQAVAIPTTIPIRELLPWVIFAGLICLLGVYFVGAEEGATSIVKGMYVHEFVHDSRHLLGFPCH